MQCLFEPENAELLISVARLSLQAVDRMASTMPADEPIPAGEVAALARLIGGALSLGLKLT